MNNYLIYYAGRILTSQPAESPWHALALIEQRLIERGKRFNRRKLIAKKKKL